MKFGFVAAALAALAVTGCCTCPKADAPAPKYKLGMAGYTFHKKSLDETLAAMQKLDLHYMTVKDFHLPLSATDAEIAAFKEKLAKVNVTPVGIGPIYMNEEAQAKQAFEFAKRLGVKLVVGVPYEVAPGAKDAWGKDRHESRKLCEYISKLCAEYDIRYAIHNHGPDIPNLFPTGENSYNMVKDLDPRMGLCLDIGHDFRAKHDPAESVRKYADRLFDVHLKNVMFDPVKNIPRSFPHGEMDLPAVARALAEVGYDGACSIEYERDFENNTEALLESVGYFKGIMDSLK